MNPVPVTFEECCQFVADLHRHHRPPVGWKFGIGAEHEGQLVGVVMVSRPVARRLDNGSTLEVTRCCTDGTKNACSFLYASAWRAAKALGYTRIITYTLPDEGGASLRASGWKCLYETPGRSWSVPSRNRATEAQVLGPKLLWEAS